MQCAWLSLLPNAFNIAGHYYEHWEEGPKEVFQQLCPILYVNININNKTNLL